MISALERILPNFNCERENFYDSVKSKLEEDFEADTKEKIDDCQILERLQINTKLDVVVRDMLSKNGNSNEVESSFNPTNGRCVIMNYNCPSIKKFTKRSGQSEFDVELLRNSFEQLFFDVDVYEDLSYSETSNLFLKMSFFAKSKNSYDCLIVCLISYSENQCK